MFLEVYDMGMIIGAVIGACVGCAVYFLKNKKKK